MLSLALPLILLSVAAVVGALPAETQRRATSGKRGIPYNNAALANLYEGSEQVTWAYNWAILPGGLSSHFDYVPMLFSDPTGDDQYISHWRTQAQDAINAGSTHLLAFNEPDLNNLSPSDAAKSYMTYMQPFASKTVRLGAPGVSYSNAPGGLTWLSEFLGNCTDCTIDFIPFHWYCGWDNLEGFTSHVRNAYQVGGHRPLWMTEFQGETVYCDVPATDQQQVDFMETVLPWLDSLSYMERYSYFMATASSDSQTYLVNEAGGGLTQSGQAYGTISNVNSTIPTSPVDHSG